MSNALLSDVEARAERRRLQTHDDRLQGLAQTAWAHANAATDPADILRWLDRAHRLAPRDGVVTLALATSLLGSGALQQAAALFQAVVDQHGTAEAWAGLATCAHLLGDTATARKALSTALHRRIPDPTLSALADAIAPGGWCGLTVQGVLHAPAGAVTKLDGAPLHLTWSGATASLPPGWQQAGLLTVETPEGPALGSPLPVRAFAGVEGFVEAIDGGIAGWAWTPTDPSHIPTLSVSGPLGHRTLVAEAPATTPATIPVLARPHARPRHFALSATEVASLGTPLALRGPNGRHLLGSPLDPALETWAAITPGHAGFAPVWADLVGPEPTPGPPRPVTVVIPVHGGRRETLACLDSVLVSLPRGARVLVVDDASPDAELGVALLALARRRRIALLHLPENRGFPGAANAGMRAAAGRDVVLLNSDTLVPPGWLERLRRAAYAAPDIGTATPLSNDGTIVSYPDPAGGNPVPDLAQLIATDALAQAANPGETIDLPVGVGFCLYLRRDCLDQIGLLREDLFAQGYGEENDLCLRARHHGFRNVAALDVVVAHVGATSFGSARTHLVRRNAAILARLHPGYDALVARHIATDPLRPARHRMDALRWAARRGRKAPGPVVMITHAGGGGVDRVIADRSRACRIEGSRVILLQPWPGGVRVSEPDADPTPNLLYRLPEELPDLVRLLRQPRPSRVELHHMLGHGAALADLAARLGVPLVSVVHDYARFCPRIALVSVNRRYCGEPDVTGCEACIADLGSLLEDDPAIPELIRRSTRELAGAAQILAPSQDAATRMRRHFPGIVPLVRPWGDDHALPPLAPAPQDAVRRIVVVGAIGVEKGYEVLLACVRDARDRALPLAFVVVGYTADDDRLMAAGPVHVTGQYEEAEVTALIQAQNAQAAFIPSVWPETWCFALSRTWEAGLAAAVFDLGAQAERVRTTGRGWLLPLGLPASRVNDALLRLAPDRPPGHSPPTFS